jgi:hypothetical protein
MEWSLSMTELILKNIFQPVSREQFLEYAGRMTQRAEALEGTVSERINFSVHRSSLHAPEARHPDGLEAAIELDNASQLLATDNPEDITQEVWDSAAYVSFSLFFNNEKHRGDMSWGSITHDKNKWKRAAIITTRFDDDLQHLGQL